MQRHLLQGSFYFISSERINHKKDLYTIQNMIGDLGGISIVLYNVSGAFAYYVSLQFVWGSFIHQLFCVHHHPKINSGSNKE